MDNWIMIFEIERKRNIEAEEKGKSCSSTIMARSQVKHKKIININFRNINASFRNINIKR